MSVPCFARPLALIAQESSAIHSCNGVITNRPCEVVAADAESPLRPAARPTVVTEARTLPATAIPTVNAKGTAVVKSKKELLLHDLRTKYLREKKKLSIDFDITQATDACTSPSTSLEECRSVVSTLNEKLDARIDSARQVAAAEKQAQVSATTVAKEESAKTKVIVLQPQLLPSGTPLAVFDAGPLFPVDPRYRPGSTTREHPYVRPEPIVPPKTNSKPGRNNRPHHKREQHRSSRTDTRGATTSVIVESVPKPR